MQIDIPFITRSPYGLMIVLSVLIGFCNAVILMRRSKVSWQTIALTCMLTIMCTMVCSCMASVSITEGGISFSFSGLGAGVGMIIGIFISTLIFNEKNEHIMSSFIVSAPLMYGIAKIGCFMAGCCHGKEYTGPLAVTYHNKYEGTYFPIQIVESVIYLLIFVISLVLTVKMKNKIRVIAIIFAIVLPVRFITEYFRYYNEGKLISPDQIIVLIAASAAALLVIIWHNILKRISRKSEAVNK
ncbi:MAG: prolipoprotein diacylglyceryl transferase [Clostridiales bacterium]|nr:prolipoprotein diacylglyceryl transferase [Clostridiales bacterium]